MKYNIPLPRLLDANGNEIRRINVQSASVHLSISPLSTASLNLPKGETVPMRSWVEVFTSGGSAGIFRSRAPQEGYGDLQNSVELDHGICEIGDYIVKADLEEETTAAAAITKIFSHYGGTLWSLGTVGSNATVTLECDHDNVLSAIGEIMDQIPGYMFSFNQSVRPWVLSIIARPSNVTAEGRLSRNVQSARITEDDSELCTRVYMDELTNGHMDADTIGTYGIVEKSLTGGANITAAQAQRMASVYLEKHKRPALSIDIQGQDLAAITGETFDALAIGKKYRLAMPQYSRTVEETIVGLNWDDVYNNPGAVQVMLSEQGETVISYLNKQNKSGGRSGGKARKKNEKQVKEFETEFIQTNTEISLRAYQRDMTAAEKVLKDAGIGIKSNGVMIYSLDNTKGVGAALKVNSDNIALKVSKNGVISSINQTPESVTINASKINLTGYVTASQLSAVSADISNLRTDIATGMYMKATDFVCTGTMTYKSHALSFYQFTDSEGRSRRLLGYAG